MPTAKSLRPLLDARSVAIVGAVPARDHAKLASKPVANLRRYGFSGSIFPVNPKFETVSSLPCYPDLSSIPERVDAVMFLRRANHAAETIREMAEIGIPAAVICSGGFAEVGADGVARQEEVAEAARSAGIAVCGPNTNGILNLRTGMMLGFHPLAERDEPLRAGGISIVSHSGTVTGSVMARLQSHLAGFGYVISAGNEATVQAADYMEYIAQDEATKTVVLYLEQIKDGERFLQACDALREAGKSVLALKAGASDVGARVAFGHTGALVGSRDAFVAAANEHGVAVFDDLEELVAASRLSDQRGSMKEVVGLSMSGGLNGLMADAVVGAGVRFPALDNSTVTRLRDIIPISNPTNPFDLTGVAVDQPGVLSRVLHALAEGSPRSEILFSLGYMPDATWPDWAAVCEEFINNTGVALTIHAAAGRHCEDGYEQFERRGIPVFDSMGSLLRAAATLRTVNSNPPNRFSRRESVADHSLGSGLLPATVEARRELLAEWDLPYVPYVYVDTIGAAVAAASDIGFPVAMKVASESIPHKAQAGLLELDIYSPDDVAKSFTSMASKFHSMNTAGKSETFRVEIQGMLPRGGMECFIGGRIDPTFGPVVTVGPGGILVEALASLSSAIAPLTTDEAETLIQSNAVLARAFNVGDWDLEKFSEIVSRFARMLVDLQSVVDEVECNPVLVYRKGAYIVDDLWVPSA